MLKPSPALHAVQKAFLTTRFGEPIVADDPVREAGKLLHEGSVLAIKGYGGFHIAASVVLDKPLLALDNET